MVQLLPFTADHHGSLQRVLSGSSEVTHGSLCLTYGVLQLLAWSWDAHFQGVTPGQRRGVFIFLLYCQGQSSSHFLVSVQWWLGSLVQETTPLEILGSLQGLERWRSAFLGDRASPGLRQLTFIIKDKEKPWHFGTVFTKVLISHCLIVSSLKSLSHILLMTEMLTSFGHKQWSSSD